MIEVFNLRDINCSCTEGYICPVYQSHCCHLIGHLFHCFTDAECQQREEQMGSLPIHNPSPRPRTSLASEMQPATKKPPVKPRRSVKGRPMAQQSTEQLKNQGQQKENEVNLLNIRYTSVLAWHKA